LQSTTTQTYSASPTPLSTLAGLGTGIAGASKLFGKKGGLPKDFERENVKGYLGGGIMSLANRERIAEDLTPQQLDVVIANKTIPQDMGKDIQQDNINMAQREMMANAAAQAAAQQDAGITAGQTNLPTQTATMAQGGIVAFSAGGVRPTKYTPSAWDFKPEALDTSAYQTILNEENNPATGKPWTREDIAARNRAEEKTAGIKDFYADREAKFTKQRSDLEKDKDRALGASFMAMSEQLLSSPGNTGWGKGIGAFGKTYGAELKDIKATEREIDKNETAAQDAQQAMLQARLTGDRSAYKEAEQAHRSALTGLANAKNENTKAKNAVGLEQAKAGAEYEKAIDVQSLSNDAAFARASKQGKIDLYNKAVDNAVTQMKNLYPLGAQDPKFQQMAREGGYKSATAAYNAELKAYVNVNLGGMAAESGVDPTKIKAGADTATGDAAPMPKGLPMPKLQKDLIANKVYDTNQGPAMWDGKQFVAL
jgi:hypothetical protein